MVDDNTELAAQAYIFGFPLVFNLEQVSRYVTTGVGANEATPFNTFSHARTLASPKDTFVSINNDTVYSMAPLDLSVGPIRLHVPYTGDRYYVLQFVDAWTDNFAYVGMRATGTGEGEFLLVPPGWADDDTGGATVIRVPTRVASIVGRWACSGPDDLPAVHALQDATTLTQANETFAPAQGLPEVTERLSPALDFFEKLRVWSQAFPPAPRDLLVLESFAPLGLTGDVSVADLPDDVQNALEAGYRNGTGLLEKILHSGNSPKVNGWNQTYHVFDYNLDYFEVGTIDSDEWKLTDPRIRITERAASARGGLWGNNGYEAAYVMTYVDADGEQLTGDNTYTLRLSPTPPVGAFWSVTMYNVPDFYLIENPINRNSLGDRTPGVVRDDDGGITITMSASEPAEGTARANWLPAPSGEFRPILRMYMPDNAVLDGTYEIPAIVKIG